MTRAATIERTTLETQIKISLDLDQNLTGKLETGHAFLDHMLDQIRRHGRLGFLVEGRGDVAVDAHHLAEDTGITLGMCVLKALGDKRGIERYADAFVPMDETLAHVVLDFSGRAHLEFRPEDLGVYGDLPFARILARFLQPCRCNFTRSTIERQRGTSRGRSHFQSLRSSLVRRISSQQSRFTQHQRHVVGQGDSSDGIIVICGCGAVAGNRAFWRMARHSNSSPRLEIST
jgi:imidazoleglycerol phosphate dehydratase HisB